MITGYISQIPVAQINWTPIFVQSNARVQISFGEDASVLGYPSTDFLVVRQLNGVPRRIKAGGVYQINLWDHPLDPNSTTPIAYVKAVTGATMFFQDES